MSAWKKEEEYLHKISAVLRIPIFDPTFSITKQNIEREQRTKQQRWWKGLLSQLRRSCWWDEGVVVRRCFLLFFSSNWLRKVERVLRPFLSLKLWEHRPFVCCVDILSDGMPLTLNWSAVHRGMCYALFPPIKRRVTATVSCSQLSLQDPHGHHWRIQIAWDQLWHRYYAAGRI